MNRKVLWREEKMEEGADGSVLMSRASNGIFLGGEEEKGRGEKRENSKTVPKEFLR